MKSEGNEMVPQSIQIAELLKHEVPVEPGYQLMKGRILQSGRVGLIVLKRTQFNNPLSWVPSAI
jgi:hypothetical protein